jgi:hypothetical protein
MSIAFVVRDDTSAPSTEEDALAEKTRDDIFSLIIFFLFLLVFANNAREEEVLLPEIIAETEEHAREDILSLSPACLNNARAKKL